MPSDGKRHQRITVKRGCVKMNSKQVLRKGQYRLSHNTFAKKENQLSTPPVFKSDTTCSQFKLLLRYLIQTQLAHSCIAWSTSTFQLPFFRFLYCKWNSLTVDIPVYHFFCIIILLQDEHTSQLRHSCCRGSQIWSYNITGDNVHVSKHSQVGNPNYNLFLFWDVRQREPSMDLWDLQVVRMSTEKTPCPATLVSISGGNTASRGFSGSHHKSQ